MAKTEDVFEFDFGDCGHAVITFGDKSNPPGSNYSWRVENSKNEFFGGYCRTESYALWRLRRWIADDDYVEFFGENEVEHGIVAEAIDKLNAIIDECEAADS